MKPLIQLEDIENVSPISKSINSEHRVEPFILEAQRFDLFDLLGKDLFYDFFANLTDAKYVELLNGKTYVNSDGITIEYSGLKNFLSYYTLSRFLPKQQFHITKSGLSKKRTEESDPLTGSEIQVLINSSRNNGASEAGLVRMFLDDNEEIYEHWHCNKSTNKIGVNISAIGGSGNTNSYIENDYLYE